jgi:hypothetical protein
LKGKIMGQALAAVLLMLTFGTLIVQSQERRTLELEGANPTQPGKYHKLLDVLAGSWDALEPLTLTIVSAGQDHTCALTADDDV